MNTTKYATSPMPGWKRAIDLLSCALAFPVLAGLTLCTAVLMRLTSPGVIFFRQERVGFMGRKFKIFKFRTMHMGSDTRGHQQHFAQLVNTNSPMQKLDAKGDSRLIAGAWILRSTGLDELPQIVNVWRGDMSIVGPRPCIPYEYEEYTDMQRERFRSVPGLTGLWQVSGKNRTTFEEMIRLDREYTERKSLLLDLKIILMTVPALGVQVADTLKGRRGGSAVPMPSNQVGTSGLPPIRQELVRSDAA
jgi:lipopolysaccharide/colanic/teichoic acid biosynthesis glycosyltransferase